MSPFHNDLYIHYKETTVTDSSFGIVVTKCMDASPVPISVCMLESVKYDDRYGMCSMHPCPYVSDPARDNVDPTVIVESE